ncbi:MAG TPA: PrsW family glutamic-type intramembrane protease [Flavisolibacter sp.]
METTLELSTYLLECIDGKDDHFSIGIKAGQLVILSAVEGENFTMIKELENHGGVVIVSNIDNKIVVDGTDCPLPVKINGTIISKSELRVSDVLRIGNSIWRIHAPTSATTANAGAVENLRKGFTSFIGLEELKDFKFQQIFSEVFKKHSLPEMEDQLTTGTYNNTPALTDIEVSWAKPWLFSRMLLVSLAIAVLLIVGYRTFENANLLPGLMFIGSFAVPLSTLIFFLEMNAPRNISVFMVMTLAFFGGVTSLFFALVLFDRFEFLSSIMHASAAGIIEEAAKVLVVILIVGRFTRYKWILNGLLFGAAIGMGFAAFESAGYAYRSASFDSMVDSLVFRGLLSPFMHIVWTANASAAFWLIKSDRKFSWDMLGDMRFIRVLVSSMLLHMVWNAEFGILPLPFFMDLKYLILGAIAWVICFRLVQAGLKQLNDARRAEVERLTAS